MLSEANAAQFDSIVEAVLATLPARFVAMLDEVPLIVLDRPDEATLMELGIDPHDDGAVLELCGLHTGTMQTETSVEDSGELPSAIHIFREGVLALAGGFAGRPESTSGARGDLSAVDAVSEQIRITILHELGHQFGLEEDDLTDLGYQ